MRTKANLVRKAALTSLFALCASSTAFAQTATPTTGLGQAWPNAADLSASPNWHVYVFMLNGVKYIQVNDLNGTVHAAVGTASGTAIVLPIGVDSQNMTTTSSSSGNSSNTSAQTIYTDNNTQVTASPQANGTVKFETLACPAGCTGGG
jgi:hypothetical protein